MLDYLKDRLNTAYTENGAMAYATTRSYLLDFFAQGGALRNRSSDQVISLFDKAFGENPLLALRTLFYFRDIRGGQGERKTFRTILKHLANVSPDALERNIQLISEYGRWDDLLILLGTKVETKVMDVVILQLNADLTSKNPSLLAKWLPSENTSSPETRRLAKIIRTKLGMPPRKYRKTLTKLRNQIRIVETQMSSKQWSEIDYSSVPSQAGLKYRQAFRRNDGERYQAFLDSVSRGEAKMNVSTLFPYEIVRQIPCQMELVHGRTYNAVYGTALNEDELNLMWANLPDYIGENAEDALAVIDTSGSMRGLPSEIALSLGLYLAERNKGAFKNHFITFSERPQLVEIQGSTFCQKVRNISRTEWGRNTNIEAVFMLILNTAVRNRLPQDQLPSRIYVISDMEFDACSRNNQISVFAELNQRFAGQGYKMPQLVFWNVNARTPQFPMTINDAGVQLVSGSSPSIFKNVMKGLSAYDLMLDVLNSERYAAIMI